jgi:hypothetical protein
MAAAVSNSMRWAHHPSTHVPHRGRDGSAGLGDAARISATRSRRLGHEVEHEERQHAVERLIGKIEARTRRPPEAEAWIGVLDLAYST